MSKMNFKSTLWALAFACAAVSCSDDLENGPNNNEGNELNGPTTYMKVTVNQGVATKAANGEEGNVDDGEVGEEYEYKVDDVTVILYTDNSGNAPTQFDGNCKIVAVGFAATEGMSAGNEEWHKRTATVEIKITDKNASSFNGKTYGVITVTNLGAENDLIKQIDDEHPTITTGAQLANYLQQTVHSNKTKFIMSTHNDKYANSSVIFDQVTLSAASTPETAPTANVHVERLAAKIRINQADDVTDFIYTLGETNAPVAKVRLDEVAIVNQLCSGTYLLKRVGTNESDYSTDTYLGNETVSGDEGTNYVIDPWTRGKDAANLENRRGMTISPQENAIVYPTNVSSAYLKYYNNYVGDSINEVWENLDEASIPLANTDQDKEKSIFLAYTQENTTLENMQKNGYSTGALFKATYFPKQWAVTTYPEDGINTTGKVAPENIYTDEDFNSIDKTTEEPANFFVYQGNIYKDYEAIFNEYVWTQQKSLDGKSGAKIYDDRDFKVDKIKLIKKKDFFNSELAKYPNDPLGYIGYLKKLCDSNGDGTFDAPEDASFEIGDAFDTYLTSEDGQSKLKDNILIYRKGVCYYPYWIRHINNGNNNEMGMMEFAIVRNNIYDLTVTGINKLGLSGAVAPKPGEDDETDELFFNVVILVKNWVVRSNSGIIL